MRYRSACAASTSAAESASLTCSGPDRISTTRSSIGAAKASAGIGFSTAKIDRRSAGALLITPFDLLIAKLNHTTRLQVNQMVVVCARHFLVAGSPIAKIVSGNNAGFFE